MKNISVALIGLAQQGTPGIIYRIVISFVLEILIVIAQWKMFEKMDEKGWKSLIPIYNRYILLKYCSNVDYLWQLIVGNFATITIDILYYAGIIPESGYIFWIALIVQFICYIWVFILNIKIMYGVSTSFGHGKGFTVGLVLLPFIFLMILGFGSSEYEGDYY